MVQAHQAMHPINSNFIHQTTINMVNYEKSKRADIVR